MVRGRRAGGGAAAGLARSAQRPGPAPWTRSVPDAPPGGAPGHGGGRGHDGRALRRGNPGRTSLRPGRVRHQGLPRGHAHGHRGAEAKPLVSDRRLAGGHDGRGVRISGRERDGWPRRPVCGSNRRGADGSRPRDRVQGLGALPGHHAGPGLPQLDAVGGGQRNSADGGRAPASSGGRSSPRRRRGSTRGSVLPPSASR